MRISSGVVEQWEGDEADHGGSDHDHRFGRLPESPQARPAVIGSSLLGFSRPAGRPAGIACLRKQPGDQGPAARELVARTAGDVFDPPDPQASFGPGLTVELHDVRGGGGVGGEWIQHGRQFRLVLRDVASGFGLRSVWITHRRAHATLESPAR